MISAFFSPTDVVTEEITVVTQTTQFQTSQTPPGSFPGLKFGKPVYIGEEFAVVDRDSVSNWFLVSSLFTKYLNVYPGLESDLE